MANFRNVIKYGSRQEISSGAVGQYALKSLKLTMSVSAQEDLAYGACCSNVLDFTVIAKGGTLTLQEGTELQLCHRFDDGRTVADGVYYSTKTEQKTANTYHVTAYDAISKLDKDVTDWLRDLNEWPYKLTDFARMICTECELTLENLPPVNGEYLIQKFLATGITGRQLMKWCGEIAGSFLRATIDGKIRFDWYTTSGVTYTPGGQNFYYAGSLQYADYQTAKVECIRIKATEDDVGVTFPTSGEPKNNYDIVGNYLLSTASAEMVAPVAEALYYRIKDAQYTPLKVRTASYHGIETDGLIPGRIITVTDKNGKTITTYIMKTTRSGGALTAESTGNASRQSVSAINNITLGALNQKMLEVHKSIEGLGIRASSVEEKVDSNSEKIAEVNIRADSISSTVQSQEESIGDIKTSMSQFDQRADGFELWVEKAAENGITSDGVTKVRNRFGLTIDESAVTIQREGEEMTNSLTEKGMYVIRSRGTQNEEIMLQADARGVDTANQRVRNYLIIGKNSRLEDYAGDRTAIFHIAGGATPYDW